MCAPGSSSPCYDGPPGTEGVGIYQAGNQTCNATGTAYGACVGAVTPTAETYGDGLDNDFDGLTDEGCIGDRAWRDIDGNGLQDPGEPGLAGVVFILRNGGSGAVVAIATSDPSGGYVFSGVPPGSYYVEVVPPAGFGLTTNDVGADDALDSDFDGGSLASPLFILVDNTFHIDCGFTTAGGF